VLVLALGAGGCGERPDPEADARAAVATFVSSCEKGDTLAAQYAVNEEAKKAMLDAGSPSEACGLVLGFPPDEDAAAALAETELGPVDADGGFANVQLESPAGVSAVELEYVRGRWLIARS